MMELKLETKAQEKKTLLYKRESRISEGHGKRQKEGPASKRKQGNWARKTINKKRGGKAFISKGG